MRPPKNARIIYADGREKWFDATGFCYREEYPMNPRIQAEINLILKDFKPRVNWFTRLWNIISSLVPVKENK